MKIYTKSFLALFISFNISSESLLDIYNEALENDPTYKAAEYSYLADKELKVQGRAALLPSITLADQLTGTNTIKIKNCNNNITLFLHLPGLLSRYLD